MAVVVRDYKPRFHALHSTVLVKEEGWGEESIVTMRVVVSIVVEVMDMDYIVQKKMRTAFFDASV